jgi:hypothetical protein
MGPRTVGMTALCSAGGMGASLLAGWRGVVIACACYLIGACTVWATQADIRSAQGKGWRS